MERREGVMTEIVAQESDRPIWAGKESRWRGLVLQVNKLPLCWSWTVSCDGIYKKKGTAGGKWVAKACAEAAARDYLTGEV